MGVSSLLGFLGSVAFPLLRTKLGTSFTALIGCTTKDIFCQTPHPISLPRSLHLGAVRRHLRHLHLLAHLSADDQDQHHHFTVDGQDQHHLAVDKRGRGQDRHHGTG